MVSPHNSDRSTVLSQLVANIEVNVFLDCSAHYAGQPCWHPWDGKGKQVIEGGIKNLKRIVLLISDPSCE